MIALDVVFFSFIFPSLTVLWRKIIDPDWKHPHLSIAILAPLFFYIGTCIFALIIARKCEFYKYKLNVVRSGCSACLGCLFFWGLFFPYFLKNWMAIVNGQAKLKGENDSFRFGYSLNVVLGVICWNVVWLYPMSQIVPSTAMVDRRDGVDSSVYAIKSLIAYGEAQKKFKANNFAKLNGVSINKTGYCDNFQNLYYGLDSLNNYLSLIPKEMADAAISELRGAPTMNVQQKKYKAYNGYFFEDDPYIANNNLWDKQFGLIASPEMFHNGFGKVFWIGIGEEVLHSTISMEASLNFSEKLSPLSPKCEIRWEVALQNSGDDMVSSGVDIQ